MNTKNIPISLWWIADDTTEAADWIEKCNKVSDKPRLIFQAGRSKIDVHINTTVGKAIQWYGYSLNSIRENLSSDDITTWIRLLHKSEYNAVLHRMFSNGYSDVVEYIYDCFDLFFIDDLQTCISLYQKLLSLPIAYRIPIDSVLATLRNTISEKTNKTSQEVQDYYENNLLI